MMVRTFLILCACGLVGLPAASYGANAVLTEQAVYRLADDIETASEAKDIRGILQNLSKSVTIEVKKRNKASQTFDYESYQARLIRMFPLLSYYDYVRSNEAVEIHEDGQSALLRFDLEERYVVNGRYNKEKHAQEWLVVLEDGTPRVEKLLID